MSINQEFRNAVGYVRVNGKLQGTAFFVSVPVSNGRVLYAVTAMHLLPGRTSGIPVALRVNDVFGQAIEVDVPASTWHCSDVQHTDVAVVRFPESARCEPTRVLFEQIADDQRLHDLSVGIGDEVFFVGMMQELAGETKNLPVVRFGQIARMDEELIPTREVPHRSVEHTEAILTEARSWIGYSGSPVFLTLTPDRRAAEGLIEIRPQTENPMGFHPLLGLVAGFWELPRAS